MAKRFYTLFIMVACVLATVACSSYLQSDSAEPPESPVQQSTPQSALPPITTAETGQAAPTAIAEVEANIPEPTAGPVVAAVATDAGTGAPVTDQGNAEQSVGEAQPVQEQEPTIAAPATIEPTAEPPTAEPIVEPTPIPEEPTPEPEPAQLGISLVAPIPGARVVAGTALSVSGDATAVEPGQSISVALVQQNVGIVNDVNLVAQEGRWSALLPAPSKVVGPMLVVTSILDSNGNILANATVPVEIVVNEGSAESYIQINALSPIAIAGKGMHLTGTASSTDPTFKINLGVFFNNCSETGGLVSFDMYFPGYWEGYLTIPDYVRGDACVFAFSGGLGSEQQRLAQIPIFVMAPEDENAIGVVIANPRPSIGIYAPLRVDGIAYNPPNGVVNVAARLPNGTVLWEDRVIPDEYGYWEAFMQIGDGEYAAEIVAYIGDPNNPIQTTHPISIVPVNGN